jgi:hypothetical protein
MTILRNLIALSFVAVAACSRPADHAVRPAEPDSAPPAPRDVPAASLSDAARRTLIDAMIPLIDAHYLFPEVGTKMIAALREHAARGDYASVTKGEDFAKRVTDDLRAVSHDLHVMLQYSAGPEAGPSDAERAAEAALDAKLGFVAIERLPGNVALVRIDSFTQPASSPTVVRGFAANMSQVADASALILDLRENYGGDPSTVALLLSYLFDPAPVHLNDIWMRDGDNTWRLWTRADVAGERFGAKKPIYVLTSKTTISGGEEAAYDLQANKRAVLVGETTAGAANIAPRHKLDAHFTLLVPMGRAINPITHTNWEGTGVVPDVPVTADAAPHEAHVRALGALIAALPRGAARTELEKVRERVSASAVH